MIVTAGAYYEQRKVARSAGRVNCVAHSAGKVDRIKNMPPSKEGGTTNQKKK